MKKIICLYLFFSLLITCFASCSKDSDNDDTSPNESSLRFASDTIYIGQEGGNLTLVVKSDIEWTIINSEDNKQKTYYSILTDLSNYSGNGSVVVNLTENKTYEKRVVVQEIKGVNSSVSAKICIVQAAKIKEVLKFSNDTVYVDKKGGNTTINVVSTTNWSLVDNVDNQSKTYYSIVSGKGNHTGNGSIVVNFTENTTGSDRIIQEEIRNSDSSESAKVTIIQLGDKIKTGVFATFVDKGSILIERRSYQTTTTWNVIARYDITTDLMYESTANGKTRLYFEGHSSINPIHTAQFYLIYDSSQYSDIGLNQLKALVANKNGYDDLKISAKVWSLNQSIGRIEEFSYAESNGVISYNFVDNYPKGGANVYYFNGTLKFKFAQ